MANLTVGSSLIIIELARSGNSAPRIKQLNRPAAVLLAYSAAELIDQPLTLIYADAENMTLWSTVFADSTDKSFECELSTKNNMRVPVFISCSVLLNPAPDKVDVALEIQPLHTYKSVNQCQQIESALTESEERFRQMAEMTGEWLWEQDANGYYIYSSIAVKQILGYMQDEVLGQHYTKFLTLQDKAHQQHYAASRQPFYGLVNHYRHHDGHEVFTESTGLPIFNAGGELLKWRGVDRDITAKKYFQDALIESERRTRLIIESSINAVIIMDSYGIITDWNLQSEKMFGWTAEEAIGQRLDELIIPPRFRQNYRHGLKMFLQIGFCPLLNQLFEHVAMRRDGSEFPIEASVSPLKLGNAYIFSGFIHDITSRKASEQKVREAQINLAISQSEIKIAQQIQTSLLPSVPINSAYFDVTGVCLPADRIGGDYFDYFYRNQGSLAMVIADVSGHSIGPALFMVEARSALRSQAHRSVTPAETLNLLNDFLYEDLNKADYFITLFYLQYEITNRQLSFANAGHPPPLLFRALRAECEQLDADGMILGIRQHIVFEDKTAALAKDDLLLIYTDGLTEAENPDGEFFGLARVRTLLIRHAQQTPEKIIHSLLEELKQFCRRDSFKDDITLMIFRCR